MERMPGIIEIRGVEIVDCPEVCEVYVKGWERLRPDSWCVHCRRRHGGFLVILGIDPDAWDDIILETSCYPDGELITAG